MRFQIDGVRAGTTQPVRVELEGADLQSVMAQVAAMGIVQARVKPVADAAGSPPPIPGAAAPPPIPAPPPAAYGNTASFAGNAYAGQPAAHQPPSGFPPPARKGNNLGKIILIVGLPAAALLLTLVIILVIFLWPSGSSVGKAAGTSLDPALYLPETKEGDSAFCLSANVPKVLALDASKNIRRQFDVDKKIKALGLKVTLDDLDELLVVGTGPSSRTFTSFAIYRLKKDLSIPDMLANPETADKPESIEGFDVYQAGAAGVPGAKDFVAKIGPRTYMSSECSHADISTYLARVRSGKRIEFSSSVAAAAAEIRGGDVVVCVDIAKSSAPDDPLAVAGALRVDTSSVAGDLVFLMRDEKAAKAAYDDYQKRDKEMVERFVPGTVATQHGAVLKATGSMKSAVIEENLKKFMGGFGAGM
jgi:hypothetical protein